MPKTTRRTIIHPAERILRRMHPGRQEPNSHDGMLEELRAMEQEHVSELSRPARGRNRGFGHRLHPIT